MTSTTTNFFKVQSVILRYCIRTYYKNRYMCVIHRHKLFHIFLWLQADNNPIKQNKISCINLLRSYMHHWTGSSLVQVMACHCLLQAITITNANLLLTDLLGTNFNEILIDMQKFSLTKINLKMLSAKCQPIYLSEPQFVQDDIQTLHSATDDVPWSPRSEGVINPWII